MSMSMVFPVPEMERDQSKSNCSNLCPDVRHLVEIKHHAMLIFISIIKKTFSTCDLTNISIDIEASGRW